MTRRQLLAAVFSAPLVALGWKKAPRPKWVGSIGCIKPKLGPTAEELAFYAGEQWPADVLAMRQAMGRPCLVFNRLPEIVHQVVAQRHLNGAEERVLIAQTVRQCRESQVVLNYFKSAEAEAITQLGELRGMGFFAEIQDTERAQ